MSKYLVETFYTCTFKIVHKLEELNEKRLSELENRKDGKVEIIDVRLNKRKTKAIDEKNQNVSLGKLPEKNISDVSSIINETIADMLSLPGTFNENSNSRTGFNWTKTSAKFI